MSASLRLLALSCLPLFPLLCPACSSTQASADNGMDEDDFQYSFPVDPGDWISTGRNDYFVLEPGYRLVLENERKTQQLVIRVLDRTLMVDNVETRVVEERETVFGELKEVSRNYFAMSRATNDVYYFGEDVDVYKKGALSSHEGSWHAGIDEAQYGLMMPGKPKLGAKYYQEQATDIAFDRSEITDLEHTITSPAGQFTKCLEILETSALDEKLKEKKYFAPGVGLVKDGSMHLVQYGIETEKR